MIDRYYEKEPDLDLGFEEPWPTDELHGVG